MSISKKLLKYCKVWSCVIALIAIAPLHTIAQDTSKSIFNFNQSKLVKKINNVLDSSQNKIKGKIVNTITKAVDSSKNKINNTVNNFKPKEEERQLPYERLLNTKYTIGRRVYQNTVSQFNYLFNAEEELKEIIQKARDQYQEDYSTLLSFYDYDLAATSKSSIDSIVYRCNANIVLHDLRSNWVGDAYLLLGKSYLFHRNFDTAASILQFINYTFGDKEDGVDLPIGSSLRNTNGRFSIANKETNSFLEHGDVRNESMVWQARNYLESNQINEGISLLQLLKADALFPKRLLPFLNEQFAYGYYLSDSYELSAKYLEEAIPNAQDDNAKSRWYYLLGQLWQKANNTDKAYKWFNKANEFSPNPIIGVYSKINMVRIEAKNLNRPWHLLAEELEHIAKREKYKPYKDIIYFEMAMLAIQNKAFDKANEWLIVAIKNNNSNMHQKQQAFELLGDINYNNNKFGIAKIAYDSLTNVLKTNPQYEQIMLRKKWTSTIDQEITNYQKEDSLQFIYNLPSAIQKDYATKWNARIKEANKVLANLFKEKNSGPASKNEPSNILFTSNYNTTSNVATFYFENLNTITQGKQSFIQKWGERPNVDMWRRKTSTNLVNVSNISSLGVLTKDTIASKNGDAKVDSSSIALLQNSNEYKLSLTNWNKAALKTAQTFLLQLNDFNKASVIYNKIIERNIDPTVSERALLDLASQYLHDGNKRTSDSLINIVMSKFPDGIYLHKKQDVENAKNKTKAIENTYKEAYSLIQTENWDQFEKLAETISTDFQKSKWNTPFQFLRVKMYAQQGKDSAALKILDAIISTNKSDVIKEKAKSQIAEITKGKTK